VSVLENINSLIGYFDLNPNKVLDLILDVFIANVVDHWDFFVELLLQSHWKPVMSKTGTLEGSPVLGQILGFKFDYYNNDATKTVTPPQLIWITAILIKHKLVQLEDVYPHLSPPDEDMDQELQAFKEKLNLQKKQGGKYKDTTLADAGALSGGSSSEDSGPAIQFKERGSTSTVSERNSTPQPPPSDPTPAVTSQPAAPPKPRKTNQKAVLASYLLALGSINSARLLLDRIPLLVQIHPEISDYMSRLLDTAIEPIYSTLRPIPLVITPLPATQPPPMNTLNYKIAQTGVRVGRGGKLNYPKLKFFYDAWADGLPSCATFDDVVKVLRVLLPYVCVSGDVVFVSKVARIGRAHVLANATDERVRNNWMSIVAKFLFPALSLTDQNPGLAADIWGLVKLFPYDRRYALYGEWKHKTYAAIPQLGVAKAACVSDAKYTMRRLSKETVKRFGRYIGKIGHSNPTIAFHYILELLQTYENQNATVVEGSKYMSELSFDVVTFTLIEQLGNEQKERIQPGGIGVKTWLKSLSYFTGSIFKKHAIELGGILRYLFAQLVKGNMFDMIILQEIVMQMCGIKAILDDVTSDQFNALAAGETLRREAFGNEPVRVVKKVSGRLLKALMETELVLPFAVLIGQHITGSVFVQGVGEIKILGWMLDNIRATFTQYMDFVTSNCDREVYSNLVPDIDVLRNEYGLSPEVAFAILRPKLDYLVKTTPLPVSNTASAMDLDQKEKAVDIHPALLPVVESVQKTLPESVWSILSPHFYVTFWSLTLYDIDFPKQKYLSEITKLKSTIDGLNSDKSNSGGNTPAKRRKDIAKHRETIGLLEKEMSVHETHVKKVLERLQRESAGWFGFG
ncbi:THO complex subunit 2, partial [Rhizoclosmatium hyalinum]